MESSAHHTDRCFARSHRGGCRWRQTTESVAGGTGAADGRTKPVNGFAHRAKRIAREGACAVEQRNNRHATARGDCRGGGEKMNTAIRELGAGEEALIDLPIPPRLLAIFENADREIQQAYGLTPGATALARLWLTCATASQ